MKKRIIKISKKLNQAWISGLNFEKNAQANPNQTLFDDIVDKLHAPSASGNSYTPTCQNRQPGDTSPGRDHSGCTSPWTIYPPDVQGDKTLTLIGRTGSIIVDRDNNIINVYVRNASRELLNSIAEWFAKKGVNVQFNPYTFQIELVKTPVAIDALKGQNLVLFRNSFPEFK